MVYAMGASVFNLLWLIIRVIKKNAWRNTLKLFLLSAVAALLCALLVGVTYQPNVGMKSQSSEITQQSDGSQTTGRVSKSTYDTLAAGMSYEEVCTVFGSEGTLYHESGFVDDPDYRVTYVWGTNSAYAQLDFVGGTLQGKQQFNLN